MKKRALVIGMGAMRGAYDAGVALTLCRELGPDHFDAIYTVSAGTYTAAYFALNQPDSAEDVWRNYLDGGKLINFLNPLRGRSMLNLEYITHILRNGDALLHIERLRFPQKLNFVLTEQHGGKPMYTQPTQENILDIMNASSALPFLHPPIEIDSIPYIDGSLSDPLPFAKALADGHDEVVVVYNKPKGFLVGGRYDTFSHLLAICLPKHIAHLVRTLKFRFQDIEQGLGQDSRLKVIRPSRQLPLKSILDTNKARLNACVDMGIADAKEFLKTYKAS